MKKIAINGFGRIGRLAFRVLFEESDCEVVAINDLSSNEELAYLLKYDSTHRNYNKKISYSDEGIIVDGKLIKTFACAKPSNLPWKELEVDLVLECTGRFVSLEKAMMHIDAGCKKVLISAPGKGDMKTIVYGVNHHILDGNEKVVSAASCTTNCLAPVVSILDNAIGIKNGFMTTIHAYTNDQVVLDVAHKKGIYSRRGRASAINIIPTSTGAASAIGKVLPKLDGKLDGCAFRVPVMDGSMIELVLNLNKKVSKEEINDLFIKYSNEVLEFTMEPIVSSDVIGTKVGALVDGNLTQVISKEKEKFVKIVAWYDNEYGYTNQMIRTLKYWLSL